MENLLYKVILGWPSAVLGLSFLTLGVIYRKTTLSVVGAIAATGFCLFVSTYYAPFSFALLLVIVSNWASVVYLSKGKRGIASALIAPLAVESMALAYVVFSQ